MPQFLISVINAGMLRNSKLKDAMMEILHQVMAAAVPAKLKQILLAQGVLHHLRMFV